MKRNLIYFGIILSVGLGGCVTEFSSRPKLYKSTEPEIVAPPVILLNKSFDLYCRAMDVEDIDIGGHNEKRLVPHGTGNAGARLAEIEYLFIPHSTGKAIYISTVADRYGRRYNGTSFMGLDHPNAADFRVFLIGKVADEHHIRFDFKKGNETDNWTIEKNTDQLRLIRIEQMKNDEFEDVFEIKDALKHHADFFKVPDWTICYLPKKEINTALAERFTGRGITYDKNGKSYDFQMQFEKTLVTWENKYVIYKPD